MQIFLTFTFANLDPIPQKMLTQGRRIFEEFLQAEEGA